MGKKQMDGLLGNIIGSPEKNKNEQVVSQKDEPKVEKKERPSTEKGTKPGEARTTFIVNKELVRKLKYVSLVEQTPIKDFVARALEKELSEWETKNGKIKLPDAK